MVGVFLNNSVKSWININQETNSKERASFFFFFKELTSRAETYFLENSKICNKTTECLKSQIKNIAITKVILKELVYVNYHQQGP